MGTEQTMSSLRERYTLRRAERAVQRSCQSCQQAVLAALELADRPLSPPELVLASWRASPELFGLRGHEGEHPDSNRVLSYLYGRRGLVRRGLVRRLEDGRFEAIKG